MNVNPFPAKRRVKVTSGSLPSAKIHTLAACHPFSQQLDIVFPTPTNPSFCDGLEKLETGYGKGKARLTDVVNAAPAFLSSGEDLESNLLAMSAKYSEDAWCVDPRGHLTLSVSKETYERLGLVGKPLPFKGYEDTHIIDIPLHKGAQSPAVQARVKAGIETWDLTRASELGEGDAAWDVVYCSKDRRSTPPASPFQDGQWDRVQCTKNELRDVHVPIPSLSPQPSYSANVKSRQFRKVSSMSDNGVDALDDWNRQTESLFEWVGMACLGAQRLNANDRVDPYVALYAPPAPSHVQNVTHLCWQGMISPGFVEEVLDTIIKSLQASSVLGDPSSSPNFVSVTVHAATNAPVSYIPYTFTQSTNGNERALQPGKVPMKVPSAAGEDTWSLVLERQSQILMWRLAESIGPGDVRWG